VQKLIRFAHKRLSQLEAQYRRVEPVKVGLFVVGLFHQGVEQFIFTAGAVPINVSLRTFFQNQLPYWFAHKQAFALRQNLLNLCRPFLFIGLRTVHLKEKIGFLQKYDKILPLKLSTDLLSANPTGLFTNRRKKKGGKEIFFNYTILL
jgi:hypothetical protein